MKKNQREEPGLWELRKSNINVPLQTAQIMKNAMSRVRKLPRAGKI